MLSWERLRYKLSLQKMLGKGFRLFLLSLAAFVLYYLLYTEVFGFKTPRRIQLEQRSALLDARQALAGDKMERAYSALQELSQRDNNIYRPSFGMDTVAFPAYDYLTIDNLNNLINRQQKSYNELDPVAESFGKIALCVPSIPPLYLNHITLTSRFGYRADPMSGYIKGHTGVDLAGRPGEPIYATGDGKVEKVDVKFTGYGVEVVINHGFGYKTRYAHLKETFVHVGDFVKRGDKIALMGSTGKSTGPHLHYEVEYMGYKVNPLIYFDSNMTPEEYDRLISGK